MIPAVSWTALIAFIAWPFVSFSVAASAIKAFKPIRPKTNQRPTSSTNSKANIGGMVAGGIVWIIVNALIGIGGFLTWEAAADTETKWTACMALYFLTPPLIAISISIYALVRIPTWGIIMNVLVLGAIVGLIACCTTYSTAAIVLFSIAGAFVFVVCCYFIWATADDCCKKPLGRSRLSDDMN